MSDNAGAAGLRGAIWVAALVLANGCGGSRPPAPETPLPEEPLAARFVRVVEDLATERGQDGSLEAKMLVGPGGLTSDRAAVAWFRMPDGGAFGAAHPCFDLHGVILSGAADLLDPRGAVRLEAGDAVFLPARYPFAIVAAGGPLEILEVFAAQGGIAACDATVRAATELAPPEDREGLNATQHVVRGEDAEWISIAQGKGRVQMLVDEEVQGARLAYVGQLVAEPGLVIAPHVHTDSDEILLVRAGSGTMTIAGARLPVLAGMVIRIPAGTEHAFEADGSAALRAVQIYAGPGPEQRFRAARDAAAN
jgi:putative monooxygenase